MGGEAEEYGGINTIKYGIKYHVLFKNLYLYLTEEKGN